MVFCFGATLLMFEFVFTSGVQGIVLQRVGSSVV